MVGFFLYSGAFYRNHFSKFSSGDRTIWLVMESEYRVFVMISASPWLWDGSTGALNSTGLAPMVRWPEQRIKMMVVGERAVEWVSPCR